MTAPRESTILGPDGKPIVTQVPLVPNRDCPLDMYYRVTQYPYVCITWEEAK